MTHHNQVVELQPVCVCVFIYLCACLIVCFYVFYFQYNGSDVSQTFFLYYCYLYPLTLLYSYLYCITASYWPVETISLFIYDLCLSFVILKHVYFQACMLYIYTHVHSCKSTCLLKSLYFYILNSLLYSV